MHLIALAAGLALAEPESPRTLIPPDAEHGGYGGPSATLTTLDGAPALMVGGRGAWIVDHRFSLGGATTGLVPIGDLHLGYSGIWLEHTIAPNARVHGALGGLVGLGWVAREGALAMVPALEAMAMAEANVTSFLRVVLGASWRQLGGTERIGLTSRALSGPGATLMFRFGRF